MAAITLQALEGLERGTTFRDLETPISIGREEENAVRLNDERVSRFHAKIQEDGGRVILTDLDSTNGTRVNGRPISARVLRPGDQIAVGRCLLAYGAREELDRLAAAARAQRTALRDAPRDAGGSDPDETRGRAAGEAPPSRRGKGGRQATNDDRGTPPFFPPGERPRVPRDLDLVQRAQLCDLLAFAHEEIHVVLAEAVETAAPPAPLRLPDDLPVRSAGAASRDTPAVQAEEDEDFAEGSSSSISVLPPREPSAPGSGPAVGGLPRAVPWDVWQRLMRLEMDLAESLKAAAEPG